VKVARTVPTGGKFEKTYLSEFGIIKKSLVNIFKFIYKLLQFELGGSFMR